MPLAMVSPPGLSGECPSAAAGVSGGDPVPQLGAGERTQCSKGGGLRPGLGYQEGAGSLTCYPHLCQLSQLPLQYSQMVLCTLPCLCQDSLAKVSLGGIVWHLLNCRPCCGEEHKQLKGLFQPQAFMDSVPSSDTGMQQLSQSAPVGTKGAVTPCNTPGRSNVRGSAEVPLLRVGTQEKCQPHILKRSKLHRTLVANDRKSRNFGKGFNLTCNST